MKRIVSLDQYQVEAARTADGLTLGQAGLELAGETGEVIELLKKHLRKGGAPLDKARVMEELGDVVWAVAAVASLLEISLVDVATGNIEKLRKRHGGEK